MNNSISPTTLISLYATLPLGQLREGVPMPKSKSKPSLKAYALRLPQDLYDAIENIADVEVRPVNSQMVVLLRNAVERWRIEHHTEDADVTA